MASGAERNVPSDSATSEASKESESQRAIRALIRTIRQLEPRDVIEQLDQLGANCRGDLKTLRDRLVRASIRDRLPNKPVQWDREVDERGEEPPVSTSALVREASVEGPPPKPRGRRGRPARAPEAANPPEVPAGPTDSAAPAENMAEARVASGEASGEFTRENLVPRQPEAVGHGAVRRTSQAQTIATSQGAVGGGTPPDGTTLLSSSLAMYLQAVYPHSYPHQPTVNVNQRVFTVQGVAGRLPFAPPSQPNLNADNRWRLDYAPRQATAERVLVRGTAVEAPDNLKPVKTRESGLQRLQRENLPGQEEFSDDSDIDSGDDQYSASSADEAEAAEYAELTRTFNELNMHRSTPRRPCVAPRVRRREEPRPTEHSLSVERFKPQVVRSANENSELRTRERLTQAGPRDFRERRSSTEESEDEAPWQQVPRRRSARPRNERQNAQQNNHRAGAVHSCGCHEQADRSLRCVETMIRWGFKFSADGKIAPEQFLRKLEKFKRSTGRTDEEILDALNCIFEGSAGIWFEAVQNRIATWHEFKKAFRSQYVGKLDREDLLAEFKARTQAKGEKITQFLACVHYILGHFRRPPTEQERLETIYRNLLPEYRRYMEDKRIVNLADIERYGRQLERQKELDNRYVPPPSKEKSRIPDAAFASASRQARIAAAKESSDSDSSRLNCASPPKSKKRNKKAKKNGQAQSQVAGVKERGVQATIETQTTNPATEVGQQQQRTYASAVRQPAPQTNVGQWRNRGAQPSFNRPQGAAGDRRQNWGRNNPGNRASNTYNGARSRQQGLSRPPSPGMAANQPFYGTCFSCQEVGHRASTCPKRTCFACRQMGHFASECPNRPPSPLRPTSPRVVEPECQVCGQKGAVFKNCANCAYIRTALGNGTLGGPNSFELPRASNLRSPSPK